MSDSGTELARRPRRSPPPHVPSPLDPFLREFLGWMIGHDGNLNPSRDLRTIAEEFNWQPAFAEVLFTSARSRGLVQPIQARGSRGKVFWHLSERGLHWFQNEASHDGQVAAAASGADQLS